MRAFLIYIHARKASFLPKEAFLGPFTLIGATGPCASGIIERTAQ